MGLWIAGAGVVLILVGLLVWAGGVSWFGQLPGDIRIEGERSRVFIPITSMLLVSAGLTILVNLILVVVRRFF